MIRCGVPSTFSFRLRAGVSGLVIALSSAASGSARAEALTACDGLEGREQLSCIATSYPEQFAQVEASCSETEHPRECRRDGFAAVGIAFVPAANPRSSRVRTPRTDAVGQPDPTPAPEMAPSASTAAEQPSDRIYVTIRFISAQIGPGKAGGANWDGTGTISPAAAEAVAALITQGASLATSTVSGELTSAALNTANQGTQAPDVIGFVYVSGPTTKGLASTAGVPIALATSDKMVDNNYVPTFLYRAEYSNWPVFADTRFEVSLWDVDLTENDPIGVVQINATSIIAALEKGTIFEVPVADQCSGQIVNIKLSVSPGEGATHASTVNGSPFAQAH